MKGKKFGSSSRKIVPIMIEGTGYVVQEMTGIDRVNYLNKMSANRLKIQVGDRTETRIQRLGDLELDILEPCLYYANLKEVGEDEFDIIKIEGRVPLDTINNFPASLIVDLVAEARNINNIGGEKGNG